MQAAREVLEMQSCLASGTNSSGGRHASRAEQLLAGSYVFVLRHAGGSKLRQVVRADTTIISGQLELQGGQLVTLEQLVRNLTGWERLLIKPASLSSRFQHKNMHVYIHIWHAHAHQSTYEALMQARARACTHTHTRTHRYTRTTRTQAHTHTHTNACAIKPNTHTHTFTITHIYTHTQPQRHIYHPQDARSLDQVSDEEIQDLLCEHTLWAYSVNVGPIQRQDVLDTLHKL